MLFVAMPQPLRLVFKTTQAGYNTLTKERVASGVLRVLLSSLYIAHHASQRAPFRVHAVQTLATRYG
jgi:hypothetical protein